MVMVMVLVWYMVWDSGSVMGRGRKCNTLVDDWAWNKWWGLQIGARDT